MIFFYMQSIMVIYVWLSQYELIKSLQMVQIPRKIVSMVQLVNRMVCWLMRDTNENGEEK